MTKRHIAYLACAAALLGAGVGAAPPISVPRVHVVHPGQSIQKAVNAAKPGDTVLVYPGTYHESVKVTTRGLTLRGTGRLTVIEPAARKAAPSGHKAVSKSHEAVSKGHEAVSKGRKAVPGGRKGAKGTRAAAKSCAELGNGICVVGAKGHPLKNVTIASLTVRGFARTGVMAVGTDRLTVRKVTAEKNGQWGIAEERATRSVYRENTASANGDAGLFLANTITAEQGAKDARGTVVDHNLLIGNRIGVTVRRLRNVTVMDNGVTGNCAGVFVVGDENKPKAGLTTVSGNSVVQNNKYCPKTKRLAFLQGSGIVLTGVERVTVTRNLVTGNTGKSPLSGGVVLFKSFVGVTSERNRINQNMLLDNAPADLVNQEVARSANTFQGNFCRSSKPAGLC
ncbi:right-handed parallel beta-helix repeat-containing protein [Streptomyces sp. NPDC005526]|uniref:right-handed parallel beta-helix repeat-containing protein n=1 Tax=Streptomyces sp. NPDC005526 TaxID=3156885 RepID=UPI0033B6A5D8